jgi:hypothetical protein
MLTLPVRFQITFDLRFEGEIGVLAEAALTQKHLGVGRGGGRWVSLIFHLSSQERVGTHTQSALFFSMLHSFYLQRLTGPAAFAVPH